MSVMREETINLAWPDVRRLDARVVMADGSAWLISIPEPDLHLLELNQEYEMEDLHGDGGIVGSVQTRMTLEMRAVCAGWTFTRLDSNEAMLPLLLAPSLDEIRPAHVLRRGRGPDSFYQQRRRAIDENTSDDAGIGMTLDDLLADADERMSDMKKEIRMRDEREIQDVIGLTSDAIVAGRSAWPGMTYEQGVEAALLWVLEQSDDNPMVDE